MVKRLEWVDIAKGIGIFLMVMGHSGIPRSIHDWIYSFHMPFFFILSGYFFSIEKYTFASLVKRKAQTILLPYVFFTIIINAVRYAGELLSIKLPPPISPSNIILYGEELGATWFLYVLFITELCFYFLRKNIKSDWLLSLLIIAASITSYWCYRNEYHFPYKIEAIGITLLYFGIGNLMSITNAKYCWIRNYVSGYRRAMLFFALIVIDIYMANLIVPPLNIRLNILGVHIPSLLLVITGTLLVIQMSILLEKTNVIKRFLRYIGEFSIVLIGFSQIVLQLLKATFDIVHVTGIVNIVSRYILLWIILLLLIRLMSSYCPVVIGKLRSQKQ